MKVCMFAVREDEIAFVNKFQKQYDLKVKTVGEHLSLENIFEAKDAQAIIVIGNCDVSKPVIQQLEKFGVKVIATRSVGYDNFDLDYLKLTNIQASNVPAYSPNAISEFALASSLCLARNLKQVIRQVDKNNFSIKSLIGFELRNATVGIVGTGRIGQECAKAFKGFGSKIIGFDYYENEVFKTLGEYATFETLIKQSDIISLHVPYLESTHHLINKDVLNKMKNNAIIVNTARGAVVNAKDILEALNESQIGGYAMDVYEFESGVFHHNLENIKLKDDVLKQLITHERCLVTPHIAFYSDEAVSNMVEIAMQNIVSCFKTGNVLHSIL